MAVFHVRSHPFPAMSEKMVDSYGQRTATGRTVELQSNCWVEIPQQTDAVSVEAFRIAYLDEVDAPPPVLGFGAHGEKWFGVMQAPWFPLPNSAWTLNCCHNSFDATRVFICAPFSAQLEYEHAEYQHSVHD